MSTCVYPPTRNTNELEEDLNKLLFEQIALIVVKNKLLEVVKHAARNSCCLCCDDCLRCSAIDLLRELGEIK